MLRAKVAPNWFEKIQTNVPSVLVDHAHLERRAATTALTLERYRELYDRVEELNAIAIEELEHFHNLHLQELRTGIFQQVTLEIFS